MSDILRTGQKEDSDCVFQKVVAVGKKKVVQFEFNWTTSFLSDLF